MAEYTLRISFRTRLLNILRQAFRVPFAERLLLSLHNRSRSSLISKLIPPNYLYPPLSIRYTIHRGAKMKLDISKVVDHFLYWNLVEDDYRSITAEISSSKIILDIGANIGSTALYFSQLSPNGTVYAFEPDKRTFERLKENLALNNFTNIIPVNCGLGEQSATVKLFEVDPHNPGMNRILKEDDHHPYTLIEIDTLDNFCRNNRLNTISFMKVDVEGYEYAVLKGGSNFIQTYKPLIFLELDDNNLKDNGATARQLIELLSGFGYTSIRRTDTGELITPATNFTNCHYDIIAS